VATIVDRLTTARHELEDALVELEAAKLHFEAAIGTSTEMTAYQRLRRMRRKVAAADAAVRLAQSADGTLTPA
jgi:chloramphenicol 3-O-phosphotransferase